MESCYDFGFWILDVGEHATSVVWYNSIAASWANDWVVINGMSGDPNCVGVSNGDYFSD